MIDVEVVGASRAGGTPRTDDIERLCAIAAASAGIQDGHLAVEFVDAQRIGELNKLFRGKDAPTDVLSFPIDGVEPTDGAQDHQAPEATLWPPEALELGDVVICAAHTNDLREAIVHGVLHLTGMDHERDDGEMLALQRELLAWERDPSPRGADSAESEA